MGVLGTSLLDRTGLPIPLYLPNQAAIRELRESSKKKFEETKLKKFTSTTELSKQAKPTVMASLFFTGAEYGIKPGKNSSGGVAAITFDLIMKESHALTATVSEHPVENGSNISDHIQNGIREGSFTGLVTNFSIYGLPQSGAQNPAKEAFELLKRLWEDKKLVTLVLVLDTYEDVAITNISVSRDGNSGDAQEFDISFKSVKQVQLREVSIRATVTPPKMDTKKRRQAATKSVTGTNPGTPVLDNVEAEEQEVFFDQDSI